MAINPLLQGLVNTAKTSATVVKKNTETKAKNALGGLVTTQKETMPQARAKALLPQLTKVAETTGKIGQANVAKKQEQAKKLLGGMTATVNQGFAQAKDTALNDLQADVSAGMPKEELRNFYPDIPENVVEDLYTDLQAGMPIEEAKNFYPEIYSLPTVQPKQTLGDKIIGGISKVAPFVSPIAGAVQNIGAKNVLNAGVGALEGAASVGGAIGQGLAYIDPTITVDEYKRGQENIDATAPQPIQDIRGTQAYGIGKEAGKIGASTALTRPIGGGAKGVGLLGKAALGATEGVLGTAAYNVASGDEAFNTTSGIAGAIGGAIPLLGAGVKAAAKYAAPRLQLSGLLNPAKLNQVKDMLIDEGSELVGKMDTTDVGKWMIERGFKGGKDDIIKGLTQYSDESKKALDGLLASSKSKHNVSSAKRALENIRASYADTPGLESKFAKVDQLLSKDAYTLTELNAIKREMDDAYNLFKSSGGETAGLKAEGLRNIRKDIRKYIEDVADVEGLGNVKMLNNETSVSRTLADAVSRKDSADIAREMLSVFSKPAIGGALSMNQGPFNGNTVEGKIGNFLVGGLLAGAVFSTTSKTYMANALRGLSGIQKKELSRFIATKGAEKLSKETIEEVAKVTNAIKLLKEGPLESNPLRLTTTPKTRTLGQGATVQTKRPLSLLTNNANTTDNIVNNTSGKVNKPRVNILAPKKSVQSDTLVSKADEMGKNRLYRFSNDENINSDIIRGGTWYGDRDLIKHYKNRDKSIKLGGSKLSVVEDKLSNPYIVKSEDYQTPSDIIKMIQFGKQGEYDIPFGERSNFVKELLDTKEYDQIIDIIFEKDDDMLLSKIKKTLSADKFNLIKEQPFYNQKTMTIDNILSNKLREKGYDGLKITQGSKNKEVMVFSKINQSPSIQKDLQPLYDEAKKYKSADSYIKNQGDIVYHGSAKSDIIENEGFKLFPPKERRMASAYGDGVYLTTSKSDARGYGGIVKSRIPKGLKLKSAVDSDAFKIDTKKLVEDGFDGVIIDRFNTKHIVIFDPKNIKTESQLRKIREEANKK